MEYLSLVPAAALGYLACKTLTHPEASIRRRMPNVKVKRVQVFPVQRVFLFGRVIHLHHWFSFSLILIASAFLSLGIFDYIFTRGLLIGGIIQGLTLPKGHRQIIYKDFSVERLTSLKNSR